MFALPRISTSLKRKRETLAPYPTCYTVSLEYRQWWQQTQYSLIGQETLKKSVIKARHALRQLEMTLAIVSNWVIVVNISSQLVTNAFTNTCNFTLDLIFTIVITYN